MRAVVTGTAGFIGSRLAERLLTEGWEVRGIDRLSGFYDPAIKRARLDRLARMNGFDAVEEDLNEADLKALLDGAEVVHHLAGQPGARTGWGSEFETYVRDNVLATQRLLEAASDSRSLRRFVFASSSSVYGSHEGDPADRRLHPVSPYGATKLAAEEICELYGSREPSVPIVVLRYFTVFGPGQRPDMAVARFLDAALAGRAIEVFGDGLQGRDFTYVDDAVDATIAAGSRGRIGASYDIAGGSHATVLDVIGMIGSLLGREPQVIHLPPDPGDMRNTVGDTSDARADLGYAPQTSLAEGVARQLDALSAPVSELGE